MVQILTAIIPIFLIILTGVAARFAKIADEKWVTTLNKYGLYVAFPPLIVYSMMQSDPSVALDGMVILINFVVLVALVMGAFLLTRLLKTKKPLANTYIICIFFGNIGYMGYPVIATLIPGSEGLISVHMSVYNIVLFVLGIYILEHSLGHMTCKKVIVKKTLTNPLLLAVVIGGALMLLPVRVPEVIEKALEMFKVSASPVVLFALGLFLVRKINLRAHAVHVLALTLFQLVLVPGLFYLIGQAADPGTNYRVSILEAAMPLAITPFALSENYPMEREIIAASILLSTALSPLSIAAFSSLIGVGA